MLTDETLHMQPTKANLEESFLSCVGGSGVFGVFASPACKLLTSKPQFFLFMIMKCNSALH